MKSFIHQICLGGEVCTISHNPNVMWEPEDRGPAGFRQRKTSAASVWWCFILSGLWDTPSPTGTDWSGPGKCWAAQLSCMKNGGPERRTEIAVEEARARVAHVVFQACFGVSGWLRRHQSSERVLTLTCPPAEPRTVWIDRRYGGWKCWTQTLGRSACNCESSIRWQNYCRCVWQRLFPSRLLESLGGHPPVRRGFHQQYPAFFTTPLKLTYLGYWRHLGWNLFKK